MPSTQSLLLKVLSPRIVNKAIAAFDRSTMIVVSAAWVAALLMMGFATYSVMISTKAKKEAEAAKIVEPSLPRIDYAQIELRALQNVVTRMQQRNPDLAITIQNGQNLRITSNDGSKFRQWLAALNYVDSISPEYRWNIKEFCVGKCRGEIMSATLDAQRITFSAPEIKK